MTTEPIKTTDQTLLVRCPACGRDIDPADIADESRHATGGETICLACHEEIIAGDSDLVCPGCQNEDKTMDTIAILEREMTRVFGCTVQAETCGDDLAKVVVTDWPESVTYRTTLAITTLREFDDDFGADAVGDAEVCRALEQGGAFVQ